MVEVRFQGVSPFLFFALHLYHPKQLLSLVADSGLWIQVPANLSCTQTSYIYYHVYYLSHVWVVSGLSHTGLGCGGSAHVTLILLLG